MRGIYIPGMEMPKRDATFLVHVNGDRIDLTPPRKYGEEYKVERKTYTLIPVSDHERLIDAGKLEKDEVYTSEYGFQEVVWASQIDDAPTIIPAEEGAT
ncbi:MAG: hypothetical protein IJ418_02490 [Clostridia bacterium]|nr:hypothetical protein [Clostridia bacterium]